MLMILAMKCFSRQHTSARSRTSDGDCKDIPVRKRQPSSRPSHRPYRLPRITILTLTVPYSCQAFGVPWSPVHSRLFIDCHHDHVSLASERLSWRLSAICCARTFVRRVTLLFPHQPRSYYPPLNSSLSPLCLIITLLPHRPTSN